MEEQILDAPAHVEKNLKYAGFWIRFVAYILDALILGAVNFGLMAIFGGGASFMEPNIPIIFVNVAIGIGYFVAMESSSRQATLGKMAVGIKVGKANGEAISVANALGRYFAKIISMIILYIGFMMAGWDSKKQALHDKLASTYVFYA